VAVTGHDRSNGSVLTSTNPTGGRKAWKIRKVIRKGLFGVSCPSSSLCVAVGRNGDVVTSTRPARGGSWRLTNVPGTQRLSAVSCASKSLCVAVNGAGRKTETGPFGEVAVSTDPTGGSGAWTVTKVDGTSLYGISCPSKLLCVATDDFGYAISSTDPTGGAAAWDMQRIDYSHRLSGVSCPTRSLCVAVDEVRRALVGTPAG
jgi:hypothetical protein